VVRTVRSPKLYLEAPGPICFVVHARTSRRCTRAGEDAVVTRRTAVDRPDSAVDLLVYHPLAFGGASRLVWFRVVEMRL